LREGGGQLLKEGVVHAGSCAMGQGEQAVRLGRTQQQRGNFAGAFDGDAHLFGGGHGARL